MRTRLEMHAAQRPRLAVESCTALHHTSLEAPFCRFFFIPRPREKTTHVLEVLDLDNIDARYFGLGEFHTRLVQFRIILAANTTAFALQDSRSNNSRQRW